MKKIVIIFSGYNPRAVFSFIRTLEKNKLPYVIVANTENDSIFYTVYKKNVKYVRKTKFLSESVVRNIIKSIKKQVPANEYIIAPSTEYINRYILDNPSLFKELNCAIPLVNKNLYEKISDKFSFSQMCASFGIAIPKKYKNLAEISPPFVAKPIKYQSNSGKILKPQLILNNNNKILFQEKYESNEYYYEEYINGQSYYLLYYFYKNKQFVKFSQKNLIQQPNGESIVAATSSNFHLKKESSKYEVLLNKINYYGLIMIEVKEENGINFMIEANPRFWGPSQLFIDAGVNFFEAFLYDNHLLSVKPKFNQLLQDVLYFWYGGVIKILSENKKLTYYEGSEAHLKNNLQKWIRSDVYNRKDTIEIFKKEIK